MAVSRVVWSRIGWVLWVAAPWSMAACDQPPYIPPKIVEDDTTPRPCDVEPTLSSLTANYFITSCTFSGCHDTRSAEGGLNFEVADVYASLVSVPAEDEKAGPRGKLRVVPGDPDASFIVQKVEGTMARDEGNWMPDGTDEPIDPECRIKQLRQWIADGALAN